MGRCSIRKREAILRDYTEAELKERVVVESVEKKVKKDEKEWRQ